MPASRRGPICGASNSCWRPTLGPLGFLDAAAPDPPPIAAEHPGPQGILEAEYGEGAVALYAAAGPLPPAPSCIHTPDSAGWTRDLLYYYLYVKRSMPTKKVDAIDSWYRHIYPAALNDRHRVYDLLVQSTDTEQIHDGGAGRRDNKRRNTSRIPWNQLNPRWKIYDKKRKLVDPEKICGSIVKVFFSKYMVWKDLPSQALPRPITAGAVPPSEKTLMQKISNTIKKQLDNWIPVRAFVRLRNGSGPHFIGIVGYKGDRFLCIEPWAGNNTGIAYGDKGKRSKFLAILEYDPSENALVYRPGADYRVQAVEIPKPT